MGMVSPMDVTLGDLSLASLDRADEATRDKVMASLGKCRDCLAQVFWVSTRNGRKMAMVPAVVPDPWEVRTPVYALEWDYGDPVAFQQNRGVWRESLTWLCHFDVCPHKVTYASVRLLSAWEQTIIEAMASTPHLTMLEPQNPYHVASVEDLPPYEPDPYPYEMNEDEPF